MSTDHQSYSIDNQNDAIREFADPMNVGDDRTRKTPVVNKSNQSRQLSKTEPGPQAECTSTKTTPTTFSRWPAHSHGMEQDDLFDLHSCRPFKIRLQQPVKRLKVARIVPGEIAHHLEIIHKSMEVPSGRNKLQTPDTEALVGIQELAA